MEAALDRFHALGFNACGVQDIMDTAGMPKGSFYSHFKAKERLAIEIVEVYRSRMGGDILRDPALEPVERLRRHFACRTSVYETLGFERGCLISTFALEASEETPLLRDAMRQLCIEWSDVIAALIRSAQEDGAAPTTLDATASAHFMIGAWFGATTRMKLFGSREPLDDFFLATFQVFEGPLARHDSAPPVGNDDAPARRSKRAKRDGAGAAVQ